MNLSTCRSANQSLKWICQEARLRRRHKRQSNAALRPSITSTLLSSRSTTWRKCATYCRTTMTRTCSALCVGYQVKRTNFFILKWWVHRRRRVVVAAWAVSEATFRLWRWTNCHSAVHPQATDLVARHQWRLTAQVQQRRPTTRTIYRPLAPTPTRCRTLPLWRSTTWAWLRLPLHLPFIRPLQT